MPPRRKFDRATVSAAASPDVQARLALIDETRDADWLHTAEGRADLVVEHSYHMSPDGQWVLHERHEYESLMGSQRGQRRTRLYYLPALGVDVTGTAAVAVAVPAVQCAVREWTQTECCENGVGWDSGPGHTVCWRTPLTDADRWLTRLPHSERHLLLRKHPSGGDDPQLRQAVRDVMITPDDAVPPATLCVTSYLESRLASDQTKARQARDNLPAAVRARLPPLKDDDPDDVSALMRAYPGLGPGLLRDVTEPLLCAPLLVLAFVARCVADTAFPGVGASVAAATATATAPGTTGPTAASAGAAAAATTATTTTATTAPAGDTKQPPASDRLCRAARGTLNAAYYYPAGDGDGERARAWWHALHAHPLAALVTSYALGVPSSTSTSATTTHHSEGHPQHHHHDDDDARAGLAPVTLLPYTVVDRVLAPPVRVIPRPREPEPAADDDDDAVPMSLFD